jgi:hypothetical protein
MRAKNQAFAIFSIPLFSHYPLPLMMMLILLLGYLLNASYQQPMTTFFLFSERQHFVLLSLKVHKREIF